MGREAFLSQGDMFGGTYIAKGWVQTTNGNVGNLPSFMSLFCLDPPLERQFLTL